MLPPRPFFPHQVVEYLATFAGAAMLIFWSSAFSLGQADVDPEPSAILVGVILQAPQLQERTAQEGPRPRTGNRGGGAA